MLYRISQGSVSLGGQMVLDHIDFHIKGSERIGLVGRNGSGKTTLLRLIAGQLTVDRDDKRQEPAVWTARDTSIGLLSQTTFTGNDLEKRVDDLIMDYAPTRDPFSRDYYDFAVRYRKIFTGLGFTDQDRDKKIRDFSGGEQTRIALIGLLLLEPDILLLDEPTNHLDLAAVSWLEDYLLAYPKAVVAVSHDRYFLDRIAQVIWDLSDGRLARYAGSYSHYRQEKQKQREIQRKKYLAQQEEIARLEALIDKYKQKPTKASMARSKKKVLDRMERIEKPGREDIHIFTGQIKPAAPGSKRVLTADQLKIGYDRPIKEITLSVRRGQKIGIIGENGTGKSTFLKTIAGRQPALSGKCRLGQGVETGYFDQFTARFEEDKRVFEHFTERFPLMLVKDAKKTLAGYLFTGDDTGKMIGSLSGGEKSRLYLAELLTEGPNLLLLDEPTNHMDIPARETLESAFAAYTGTMLFVSHDRYFIKKLADSLLIFEEDRVVYYPFGYDHYMDHRAGLRPGEDPAAAVEAENTRIVRELHAVPKKTRMQAAALTTDQSYADWQLSLAADALEENKARLEDLLAGEEAWKSSGEYWEKVFRRDPYQERPVMFSDRENHFKQEYDRLMREYQEACLVWYEKYLDFHRLC